MNHSNKNYVNQIEPIKVFDILHLFDTTLNTPLIKRRHFKSISLCSRVQKFDKIYRDV